MDDFDSGGGHDFSHSDSGGGGHALRSKRTHFSPCNATSSYVIPKVRRGF